MRVDLFRYKQLENPPPRTRADQARRNKLEGAEAESRAGIDPTKPKTSIPSSTGASRRIPDDLDKGNKRLTEVKNVERQALTGQIRDDLAYCQANGYEFVLITDNATTLTPELQALVAPCRRTNPPLRPGLTPYLWGHHMVR